MSENSARNSVALPTSSRWESSPVNSLDPDPAAMLICDGLLGMCSPEPGKCEIGFLSLGDLDGSELDKHKPEISVISVENYQPETLFRLQWQRKNPPFKRLRLRLENDPSNAGFFLENGMGSGRDFREMIDLEHVLNNGNSVNLQPGAFSPVLEVMDGDFHTLLLSPQTYTAHEINTGEVIPLGHLAYITAANLHCDPENGKVALDLWDESSKSWVELPPWPVKGRKIFVIADNNCRDENGKKCQDAGGKDDKCKTDFDLYFKAIIDPQKTYNVICDKSPTPPRFQSLRREIQLALVEAGLARVRKYRNKLDIRTTNPTPCGGSGFGASGSLGG